MLNTHNKILIFGGTGSLGKKLIKRLIDSNELIIFSRDEAKHWTIKNEYNSHPKKDHLKFMIGDVRDKSRVYDAFELFKPDQVIIAAALKHVDTCEKSPYESILTNVVATKNIISAANKFASINLSSNQKTLRVLYVSTDKACSPVNVYGMSKAISERLITSQPERNNCVFLCTRYGNVLESRGSIIPLFKYQSKNSSHITVTDPSMSRFVMTLDESVNLILSALHMGQNGETWVPVLRAMNIGDLAEIYSNLSNKPIKIIGTRPGEKKHEDLINESESVRATKVLDKYYVIKSVLSDFKPSDQFTYSSSDDVMSLHVLKKYLTSLGILDMKLTEFDGLKIEEIRT